MSIAKEISEEGGDAVMIILCIYAGKKQATAFYAVTNQKL